MILRRLTKHVTEWPARAEEVCEWQVIKRHHGEELILNLSYDYIAWPDMDVRLGHSGRESAFASDYRGFLSSRRLEGLLDNRRWNTRDSIERIEQLESDTALLIDDLQSRLSSLYIPRVAYAVCR